METKTFTNSSIYKAEDGDIEALLEYHQTGVVCLEYAPPKTDRKWW